MKPTRTELYTVSVFRDAQDNTAFVERRTAEGYTVFDASFMVALFFSLYNEFRNNLVDYQGEDKTYLLEEFFKLEVRELREAMEFRLAQRQKKQQNQQSDSIAEALDAIKEQNKDLDGFTEL